MLECRKIYRPLRVSSSRSTLIWDIGTDIWLFSMYMSLVLMIHFRPVLFTFNESDRRFHYTCVSTLFSSIVFSIYIVNFRSHRWLIPFLISFISRYSDLVNFSLSFLSESLSKFPVSKAKYYYSNVRRHYLSQRSPRSSRHS